MAQKRKLEKLQDMPLSHSSPDNVVMEWVDPSVAFGKLKHMETPILRSILVSAYNSCPQTRRAIDMEHDRIKKIGTAKDTQAVGNKTVWNKGGEAPWNLYDSDSAATPIESPYKLQKLSQEVPPTERKHSRRAEITLPKESPGSGYKYNTPTAVAKRAVKEARQQGLPVYCTKCKKQEPIGSLKHWPVPNGGDGVVCLECRSTRWKKPSLEVGSNRPDDEREGSNTTLWALD